jgi:hypothetical protein
MGVRSIGSYAGVLARQQADDACSVLEVGWCIRVLQLGVKICACGCNWSSVAAIAWKLS